MVTHVSSCERIALLIQKVKRRVAVGARDAIPRTMHWVSMQRLLIALENLIDSRDLQVILVLTITAYLDIQKK